MRTIYILGGVVLLTYLSYKTYRLITLDDELDKKIADGAIIIDVRTEPEYETGHISGSLNISLGTIRERYVELDPNRTYITCCSHGLRSVKAETILKEKGFKNVYNGGAWTDLQNTINELEKND